MASEPAWLGCIKLQYCYMVYLPEDSLFRGDKNGFYIYIYIARATDLSFPASLSDCSEGTVPLSWEQTPPNPH